MPPTTAEFRTLSRPGTGAMTAETLRLWSEAVKAFDAKDLEKCLELFQAMSNPTAQILYNSAVVLGLLGRHEEAIQKLTEAVEKNGYLAAAFYRRGSAYFLQKRYKEAIEDFESCGRLFRSSNHINYTPMGLTLKLFLSDVNVNCGVCNVLNGNLVKGVELLRLAQKDTSGRNISVIEKILSQLEQFKADVNAALIPLSDVAPLFRPPKILPEKPYDFMGKSKVIASKDAENSPNKPNEVNSASCVDGREVSPETMASVPPPPANAPPRRPSLPGQKSDLPPPYSQPEFPPPRS